MTNIDDKKTEIIPEADNIITNDKLDAKNDDNYEKALKEILEHVQKDYWSQYLDINKHQVSVAKTYLWVSIALIGLYSAIYKEGIINLELASIYGKSLLFLAAFSAFLSLGLCIYALPARSGYKKIAFPSWRVFSKEAYDLYKKKDPSLYFRLLINLVDKYTEGAVHNEKTNRKRANILRAVSWLLITSFIFLIFSSILFFEEFL